MSKWGIRKGTIVWFWDKVKWRRGRIIAISKYLGPWYNSDPRGLTIKPGNGKPLVHAPIDEPVVDAAYPKPRETK